MQFLLSVLQASSTVNERIARVISENGYTMGPAKMTSAKKNQTIRAEVEYFFTQDAPGTSYSGFNFLVNEVLVSLVSSAAGAALSLSKGVAPVTDNQLINALSGNSPIESNLSQYLSTQFDTTDVSRPHAYMVYLLYDNQFQIDTASSGVLRVENPNELEQLITDPIEIHKDGFLHIYVSNGSAAKAVNFDNFLIKSKLGRTRQINHYYPYGLRIRSLDGYTHDYTSAQLSAGINMYTSKELQTGEFRETHSTGLEMYDFHARFYDPQLGRWHAPDHFDKLSAAPAMQFSNPYLGIGRTKREELLRWSNLASGQHAMRR